MITDLDREIIERVRALRQKEKITQRGLGEIIGTSHNFITQVENSKSQCKYSARHL
ncbi:MAG: helix-turn-helix domain-containing protein [Alistipes sp.]|nr:helix-turn-helix domain-containing protein [Alistipes sp.]